MSASVEVTQGQSGEWHWNCWECGWVGFNCGSESFAERESSRHVCPDRPSSALEHYTRLAAEAQAAS